MVGIFHTPAPIIYSHTCCSSIIFFFTYSKDQLIFQNNFGQKYVNLSPRFKKVGIVPKIAFLKNNFFKAPGHAVKPSNRKIQLNSLKEDLKLQTIQTPKTTQFLLMNGLVKIPTCWSQLCSFHGSY